MTAELTHCSPSPREVSAELSGGIDRKVREGDGGRGVPERDLGLNVKLGTEIAASST